jgi:hypothetical protein
MSSVYDRVPLSFCDRINIRLLELNCDEGLSETSSIIPCKLHGVALAAAPEYTALSYVWGSPDATKAILLDGQPFSVRENLWNFLAEYRVRGSGGLLWIDALCIDQSSIKERNHQVAIMKHIYLNARLVIAWLGLDLEETLSAISELAPAASQTPPENPFWDREVGIELALSNVRLGENEYWKRLWIVQEFILAQSIEIWSGMGRLTKRAYDSNRLLPWCRHPHVGVNEGSSYYPARPKLLTEIEILREEHHLRQSSQAIPYYFSYVNLFSKVRASLCADVRDRVYGMLGLMDLRELEEFPIPVDYSISPSTLFVRLWERNLRQLHSHSPEVDGPASYCPPQYFAGHLGPLLEIDPGTREYQAVELCKDQLERLPVEECWDMDNTTRIWNRIKKEYGLDQ